MTVVQKARGCVLMLASTLAAFAVLLLLAEGALRWWYRGSAIDPASGQRWMVLYDPAPVVRLEPPPFVTNAEGLLVANPFTPRTNIDGYRTPDFEEPALGRKTILFIGDSFTWGESARPLDRAFVDLVRAEGYKTINLGISAIGPVQYLAQAERYVPQLKPDIVCVMFYGWNDFLVEAPIRPGLERAYMTSAGMLFATTEDGQQLSYEQALQRRNDAFPFWMTPTTAEFLSRAAIARAAAQWGTAGSRRGQDEAQAVEKIRKIREISEANGSRFMLFLLPIRPSFAGGDRSREALLRRFADLAPLAPPDFEEADYEPLPGEHFNNTGHARMAAYIAGELAAAGAPPVPGAPLWPPDALDSDPSLEELVNWLGMEAPQRTAVQTLLNHLKDDYVTVLFRRPHGGGTSPGIVLSRLRRELGPSAGLDTPEMREYLLAHTPDPAYRSYAEILDGSLTATYRQLAAGMNQEQLRTFKTLTPERLAQINTGHEPLEALLRR
jgi:lysophospholipase L1-like esterase